MKPEEVIAAGNRALHLLEDPDLSKAFEDVRASIIERWESTPVRDKDGAHELKLMLKLLVDVRGSLELAVQNGKLAAVDLKTRNRELSPAEWRALNPR